MNRCSLASFALVVFTLAGCSAQRRDYRLIVEPLPAGTAREVRAELVVDGARQSFTAPLPVERIWTARAFAGELTTTGPGGMRVRLFAAPTGTHGRELQDQAEGPAGVTARIIEQQGDGTWALRIEMAAAPVPVAPAPIPAPAAP